MKFGKIILICLLLAIINIGVVSAADVNATDDLIVQSNSDVCDDLTLIDESPQYDSAEVNEILNEGSSTIVITNKTFSTYFDGNGRLSDSVVEGSTLDFQGLFEVSDTINGIYINKAVNITSSTNNAIFMLNSTNGELGKENTMGCFVVDGVSTINIENVIFNRTQVLIYDSSNVCLHNIGIISHDYNIFNDSSLSTSKISQQGILKIYNDGNISIKDSYFYAYKTFSGIIECVDVGDIFIDNNTFQSCGDGTLNSVGMTVNLKTVANTAVMTNNKIYANYSDAFVFLTAKEILFENNTCSYYTTSLLVNPMRVQLGQNDVKSNIVVKNNGNITELRIGENSLVVNNIVDKIETFGDCSTLINDTISRISIDSSNVLLKNSQIGKIITFNTHRNISFENNIINGLMSIQSKETSFNNNSIAGPITIQSKGVVFNNNSIEGVISIESTEVVFNNNSIDGEIEISNQGACEIINNIIGGTITIGSKLSIIRNNVINAPLSDYAVTIRSNRDCINNEISNNEIYSRLYCGNNAVGHDEHFLNYIEGNTPATQISMHINITQDTFYYGENTTIIVNLPKVDGNVTMDVDGEKYVVELVDGIASQVLTKYALGSNNVSVLYYDELNDVWAIGYASFIVKKVDYCPFELVYGNWVEGKISNISVVLPDDADGTISITLTNGIYTLDIKQAATGRENKVILPGLYLGNHTLSASFSSVKYVTNSTNVNFTVVHVPGYILTADSVTMDYNDGSKYKVLVTKDGEAAGEGEIVNVTFNGKTVGIKTDDKGYATFTLDAAPKTYSIKAEYNGVAISSKVTIKNILKASNISKKKAKNIKFSATLKRSNGKAIVGKKITFKFKGKTYSAKTNKKGVATITLKNLKVGKYTITSKYGACTVKNTISIKNR